MSKWLVLNDMNFVGAERLTKGTVVDGVDPKTLDPELRASFDRARRRMKADHPTRQLIPIHWDGKTRWAETPVDVRLHLSQRPGVLPPRRVYRTEPKPGTNE